MCFGNNAYFSSQCRELKLDKNSEVVREKGRKGEKDRERGRERQSRESHFMTHRQTEGGTG